MLRWSRDSTIRHGRWVPSDRLSAGPFWALLVVPTGIFCQSSADRGASRLVDGEIAARKN